MLTSLKFNLSNAPIRRATLHGRQHIVAPMVMLTEGVHNGSGGPLLYKAAECRRAVAAWNMKPIVNYHPAINGQGVSACDPDILEKQQVGVIMNARWDNGKLRADAWIEEARANAVDSRITDALDTNKIMEVSTGLFTDNTGEPGEWNGKAYVAEATNHQPDHLALLPDQIGACSVADGAGLLQMNEAAAASGIDITHLLVREMDVLRRMVGNAMSHGDKYSALSAIVRTKYPAGDMGGPYLVDVFDKHLVYEANGKYYKQGYGGKDKLELTGDPVEVTRVTDYKPVTNEANEAQNPVTNKEKNMDKIALVAALIANASAIWNEDDRETLMAMDETALATMNEKMGGGAYKKKDKKKAAEEEETEAPVTNTAPLTTNDYIAAAPPEIREVLTNGLAAHEAQKADLITKITANAANMFSKEFLATKGLEELRGMAALATPAPVANGYGVPMFAGQATPAGAPTLNAEAEEGLPLPTMSFG